MGFPLKIPVKFKTETNVSLSLSLCKSMEFSANQHERILRPYTFLHRMIEILLRTIRHYPFLHRMIEIYRYRKTIFIFLFCSCLLLINHIYPVIHIVPPFSSKSPPNPHSNTHFISTQTLKEQFLKLSVLNATIDSLKKSNTHFILDLLNHQDLNREQKNALRKCGYMSIRSAKQLQAANIHLNKAIVDLDTDSDSFLGYETACTRFRNIDEFLFVAWEDQHTCLQQFSHVGMIHHHEGRSEGQSLLISFVFDLKIPTFLNLSHSLEMAQEIEKDCREMLDMMKLSHYDSEL